ncbi:hypothetical protein BDQ12DRAFT_665965 [Crucibulum laeve]|uniref:Uncharacterized protein n=1 Tax=Crucibulum laeve TaxID=68775 RepID=A0A5C3M0Q2_9AGAR|nr:hypothetical protein BDQ12DRAFT_665965 [Crucibulum laeve]
MAAALAATINEQGFGPQWQREMKFVGDSASRRDRRRTSNEALAAGVLSTAPHSRVGSQRVNKRGKTIDHSYFRTYWVQPTWSQGGTGIRMPDWGLNANLIHLETQGSVKYKEKSKKNEWCTSSVIKLMKNQRPMEKNELQISIINDTGLNDILEQEACVVAWGTGNLNVGKREEEAELDMQNSKDTGRTMMEDVTTLSMDNSKDHETYAVSKECEKKRKFYQIPEACNSASNSSESNIEDSSCMTQTTGEIQFEIVKNSERFMCNRGGQIVDKLTLNVSVVNPSLARSNTLGIVICEACEAPGHCEEESELDDVILPYLDKRPIT